MKEGIGKREAVLQAAGVIAVKFGIEALTLEAVAKHAGVSKGGLLYHFPTKEALIESMVRQLTEEFDTLIALEMQKEAASRQAPQHGRWLRAYVRLCTSFQGEAEAMTGALMAVSLTDPRMRLVTRSAFDDWQQRAENDGLSIESARLVRLGADGCWLRALYGFDDEKKAVDEFEIIREQLLTIIENDIAQTKQETN